MSYPKSVFKTASINLAAYLLVHGLELVGKEALPEDGGRFVFILTDKRVRESLCKRFFLVRGGKVDVHKFLEAQKVLKNLLYG